MKIADQRVCALVTASDCFDLMLMEAAGIDLSRVLWVRCTNRNKKLNAAEQAFKATDILLHNGGFGIVVVNLLGVADRLIKKVPLTTWHRFSRVAERTSRNVVFLTSVPVAQSCADLTLHIKQSSGIWTALQQLSRSADAADLPHTQIISGVEAEHEIVREKLRKPIQKLDATLSQLSKRA